VKTYIFLLAWLLIPGVLFGAAPATRPNIVFILVDDLRYDALGCTGHPWVQTPSIDRLRNEGALLKNAFVTTSLCSPSRASFLTGVYAHMHGVARNEVKVVDPDWSRLPSFPMLLQKAGYETGYIGKWHIAVNADPRPGFDYWLSFKAQGEYIDPELNENGRTFKATGYNTEILNDHALKFLEQKRDKPFCLYLAYKAVHDPRTVRPADQDLYSDKKLPEPASFTDDYRGKPRWQRATIITQNKPPRTPAPENIPDVLDPPGKWNAKNKDRLNYYRLLTAIDEGVAHIYDLLAKQGQLDNTIIIFAGDNGYFMGEHRLGDKRLMYEESLRIPLLMRYPPLIKSGATIEPMTLNIDLAPTLLDLAGAPIPAHMQGKSWRPLFAGKSDGWRNSFLYEYWLDLKVTIPDLLGVRTNDWKLCTSPNMQDVDELYDLKNDPYELHNLAGDPAHAQKLKEMHAEMERLKTETGYH
jgi:N-acetylglucosamine-6-sulfatase